MTFSSKLYFTPFEYFKFFSITTISISYFIYVIRFLINDIKKGITNNIIIPVFSIPVLYFYFIPLVFITICSFGNLCWTIILNSSTVNRGLFSLNISEKYIYFKYCMLLIFSLFGFHLGRVIFTKFYNKFNSSKILSNIFSQGIKISNKVGKGLFFSFLIFSIFLIIISLSKKIYSGFQISDLYYFPNFGRLFSIYNVFFFTPSLLIGFGLTKKRDKKWKHGR